LKCIITATISPKTGATAPIKDHIQGYLRFAQVAKAYVAIPQKTAIPSETKSQISAKNVAIPTG